MNLTPMLASDTTAAFLGAATLFIIILATAIGLVLGSVAIALNRNRGRRRLWGLLLALSPLIFTFPALLLSLMIFNAPTIAGFPNYVLIPISTAPLLLVVSALLVWRKFPMRQE